MTTIDSNAPLVSVIMITYNQEASIDEAIRGVVLQKTDFPFELIVADDASSDSTALHVRRWADKYPDIVRFIERPANLGLQHNYLDAYSRCRGRYVAICEGDDWWCSSRKLARQVKYMEEHPECSVCFHRVVNYYADTRVMSLSNGSQCADMTLRDLSRGNPITNLSVMYRALPASDIPEFVSTIPLFDYAMHSLHAATGNIHYINRPMAVYRRYSRGIWSGDATRALEMAMQVRECLIGHFSSLPDVRDGYLAAYMNVALNLGAALLKKRDRTAFGTLAERVESSVAPYMEFSAAEFESKVMSRMKELDRPVSLSRRILRRGRELVSRLVPVPRIRRF